MSISITAVLHPYGNRMDERHLATISIWTTDDLQSHAYRLEFSDRVVTGEIPKTRSGHTNLFHVLRDVLADAG